MLQMMSGFWISRGIYIAAKLGIADHVGDRPRSAEELAELTETHGPSLYRLLRMLAGVGIFAEDEKGRFAMTPLAATLQTDAPGSLRSFAIAEMGEDHYDAWGKLMHGVKTGEIAFDHVFGMDVWDYYAQNTEIGGIFADAMNNMTNMENAAIMAAGYDFSSIGKIVDVGGGVGSLLISILKANPAMKGVLLDQAHVVEEATRNIETEGLSDRCEAVVGDFFQSAPEGGDAYMLKWIIQSFDDERALALLKNCRRAMGDNGRLLVIEMVIPPGNEPFLGKFIDVNMLVMTGGRERTEAQYRALLEAGGFRLNKIIPTASPKSIIEAVPA